MFNNNRSDFEGLLELDNYNTHPDGIFLFFTCNVDIINRMLQLGESKYDDDRHFNGVIINNQPMKRKLPFWDDLPEMRRRCEIYSPDSYIANYKCFGDIEALDCKPLKSSSSPIKNCLYESVDYEKVDFLKNSSCVRFPDFKNNDSFINCIKYHSSPKKNYRLETKVKYLQKLKCDLCFDAIIKLPVNPVDEEIIQRVEIANDINITTFGLRRDNSIEIIRKGHNDVKDGRNIFLLYLKYDYNCGRFAYVSHLKRFLALMYKDEKMLKNCVVCEKCLCVYKNQKDFQAHLSYCIA